MFADARPASPTRREGRATTIRRSLLRGSLASLFVLAACGGSGAPPAAPTQGADVSNRIPVPPMIGSFSAEPATIEEGSQAVLTWEVNDPDATLKIVPSPQEVSGDSLTVSPVVTTTFRLTASNSRGIDFATVTVTVLPAESGQVAPPTVATGPQWVNATTNLVGLPSECGNLAHVAADPASDIVIAGVALQGLWALQGATDTWIPLGQGPGSDVITNRATSILWDPDDPTTFWESGNYGGGGIYKTSDNGNTFDRLEGLTFETLGTNTNSDLVSVDFTDPLRQTMMSGTHESPLLYRSTDGGQSWAEISDALPDTAGFSAWPHVLDATTHLLGTSSGDESGIFRTTNGGRTWEMVASVGVVGRPLVVPSEGAIYWLLERSQGMVRSTDGGLNWSLLASGPSARDSTTVLQLPNGHIATIGGGSLITSSDQGMSWQRLGPRFPFEPAGFTYSPSRNAFFAWRFECADGDNPIEEDSIIRLDLAEPLAAPTE